MTLPTSHHLNEITSLIRMTFKKLSEKGCHGSARDDSSSGCRSDPTTGSAGDAPFKGCVPGRPRLKRLRCGGALLEVQAGCRTANRQD
jgi:hypothetical protein